MKPIILSSKLLSLSLIILLSTGFSCGDNSNTKTPTQKKLPQPG
ncbi:hypothetical protein ACRQ5D_19750 [Mucilaginibacter sp. P25]